MQSRSSSQLRERARSRLIHLAKPLLAAVRFHEHVAAVADADNDRMVTGEVQRFASLNRALDVLSTVNDNAHPYRSYGFQFDHHTTKRWLKRRRGLARGARWRPAGPCRKLVVCDGTHAGRRWRLFSPTRGQKTQCHHRDDGTDAKRPNVAAASP